LAPAAESRLRAGGADIVLGRPVRALRRRGDGFELEHGPTRDAVRLPADAVLLALPAAPAARLLTELSPPAASRLADIEYASVAIVTLVLPVLEVPPTLRGLSGYLVPAVPGRAVKAVTVSSSKWAWVSAAAGGQLVVRCSIGRHGDVTDLQRPDEELVRLATGELRTTGLTTEPVANRVTRWGGALPQYTVGHPARVAGVRDALSAEPRIALAGAAYEGVGLAACIRTGRAAAARLLAGLASRAPRQQPHPHHAAGS
jgi:oxygen-dependent protoporphyrinogen oxidase